MRLLLADVCIADAKASEEAAQSYLQMLLPQCYNAVDNYATNNHAGAAAMYTGETFAMLDIHRACIEDQDAHMHQHVDKAHQCSYPFQAHAKQCAGQ